MSKLMFIPLLFIILRRLAPSCLFAPPASASASVVELVSQPGHATEQGAAAHPQPNQSAEIYLCGSAADKWKARLLEALTSMEQPFSLVGIGDTHHATGSIVITENPASLADLPRAVWDKSGLTMLILESDDDWSDEVRQLVQGYEWTVGYCTDFRAALDLFNKRRLTRRLVKEKRPVPPWLEQLADGDEFPV